MRAARRSGLSAQLATLRQPRMAGHRCAGRPDSRRFAVTALRALAQGDRVIASSAFSSAQFAKRYRIPKDRLAVIPAVIDTAAFNPEAVPPERAEALRQAWGVRDGERVIVVPGPIAHGTAKWC